jgi:cytoskeletal protein CcmA (bactofilin family)
VILKGRLLGKIKAEGSLEIHPAAELEGTFTAGRLVIPSGTIFRWKETLALGSADIAGEVAANLRADGLVVLRSTSRFFGQVRAGNLAVEEGAVFLGTATIGV